MDPEPLCGLPSRLPPAPCFPHALALQWRVATRILCCRRRGAGRQGKITGMLLEMPRDEVLRLLQSRTGLQPTRTRRGWERGRARGVGEGVFYRPVRDVVSPAALTMPFALGTLLASIVCMGGHPWSQTASRCCRFNLWHGLMSPRSREFLRAKVKEANQVLDAHGHP